jgi:hypothetical protein
MKFNASKTVAMFLCRTIGNPPLITFSEVTLNYSSVHRHLGFILDSKLNFHPHINAITRKCATQIFLLRRLSFKVRNRDLLLKVYNMYVRPHFEYASPAWAALTITQADSLERLQRRAMRIILNRPPLHHIEAADYALLNITTLTHQRNFGLACYMYKLINDRLPQKLMKYKLVPYVNPYSRRTHTLLAPYVHHPTPRFLDRSPLLFGLKIMSSTPSPIWLHSRTT